jgi:hypothetical protein
LSSERRFVKARKIASEVVCAEKLAGQALFDHDERRE